MHRSSRIQNIRHILYRLKAKLYHKTFFGKLIRSFGWRFAEGSEHLSIIYENNAEVFFNHTFKNLHDPIIEDKLRLENKRWSEQSDTIYRAEGEIYVEPEFGMGFLSGYKLITQTKSRAHTYLIPSLFKAIYHTKFRHKYIEYDTLIHFDGYASKNLYHFFDDALNGLLLIFKSKLVHSSTPILVTARVYNLPYFKYFLARSEFAGLNWVVQKENEWIKVGRLYKGVASHRLWITLYEMIGRQIKKVPFRRLFINRTPKFQRRLLNNDAIEDILRIYGFQTIYAEEISYEEQVLLFSEAKYVVAIHGAGITNLIYSQMKQIHLLEIFSNSLIHPHYYWFLELLGIHYYDGISASAFDINWNYTLDEEKFKNQLISMMSYNKVTESHSQ